MILRDGLDKMTIANEWPNLILYIGRRLPFSGTILRIFDGFEKSQFLRCAASFVIAGYVLLIFRNLRRIELLTLPSKWWLFSRPPCPFAAKIALLEPADDYMQSCCLRNYNLTNQKIWINYQNFFVDFWNGAKYCWNRWGECLFAATPPIVRSWILKDFIIFLSVLATSLFGLTSTREVLNE